MMRNRVEFRVDGIWRTPCTPLIPACSSRLGIWIPALNNKAWNYPMKYGAIIKSTYCKGLKVLHVIGGSVWEKLDFYDSLRRVYGGSLISRCHKAALRICRMQAAKCDKKHECNPYTGRGKDGLHIATSCSGIFIL